MRVLVTGASGFIGSGLVPYLDSAGHRVVAVQRSRVDNAWPDSVVSLRISDTSLIDRATLRNIDAIVYLAGIAHRSGVDAEAYQKANCDEPMNLATRAAECGVGRFVYLSTAKVHGERTVGAAFNCDSPYSPQDNYSRSKVDAELALKLLSDQTGLAISVLRPPLVLGPGAKGNVRALEKAIRFRIPVPVPKRDNRRAFVRVGSLSKHINAAIVDSRSGFGAQLVFDRSPHSTYSLIDHLAKNLSIRPRFVRLSGVPLAGRGLLPAKVLRKLSPLFDDFELIDECSRL